jgi:hypothetical protein
VNVQATGRPDISAFMSLFAHKVRQSHKLSRHEVYAITAFLTARVAEFSVFESAPAQLRQLITESRVIDTEDKSPSDVSSAMSDHSGELLPRLHTVCHPTPTLTTINTVPVQARRSCNLRKTCALQHGL